MFLDVLKSRFKPLLGWIVGSFVTVFVCGLIGIGIGRLGEKLGLVTYPNVPFAGLAFLIFPIVGGLIGLIVAHIFRIVCWHRLHNKCVSNYEGWKLKYTIGIVVIDEICWIIAVTFICAAMIACL